MSEEMTRHDHEMLAILHGSHDVDMPWGAWMTETCEWLRANGYAKGHYEISDKGRAYMEANPWPSPSSTKVQGLDPLAEREKP